MAEKNAVFRGVIQGETYDLLPKTGIYNVKVDDSTTLAAKLSEMITALNGKVTQAQLQEALAGLEGGGGQADWAAAEGEPGHILNRTHYYKVVEDEPSVFNNLVAADEGMYLYLGDPVVFIPGREYSIWYANRTYNCIGIDPAVLGEGSFDGGCVFGNVGAITGGDDTGEPFVIISYGRKMADMGGASVMIVDMSGSALSHVHISGPRREREKLAPEWLPIPGITLLTYQASAGSGGSYAVPHTYDYSDIAARIAGGEIVMARVDLGGSVFIGFNFYHMNDMRIGFSSIGQVEKYFLHIYADGDTTFTVNESAST